MESIDISIVVGTYNRAEMLRETLHSLTRLTTDGAFRYEIVVVNNASTDHTPSVIAETAPGAAEAVRGFVESSAGVAFARNRGIRESRGRWIAFHDDDQVADSRWLAELWALVKRRRLKCVGGNVLLRLPEGVDRALAPQCRDMLGERSWMSGEQPYGRKRIPGTNNLLVSREVLDEVGLFNTSLSDGGEDAELWRRIRSAGYEAWCTPASIVHHIIPEQRLSDDYMRWTAIRKGQHVARRERLDWGWLALWPVTTARIGQAVANYLPRYLIARAAGDREKALGARVLLWRSEGYLRQAGKLLLGQSAGVAGGGRAMNLREGREQLVKPSATEREPASATRAVESSPLADPADAPAPRLSVLMTVYNGMPYLLASVESVLAQTFDDFEFVIVNDGSTDGTVDYLESLHDRRVKVIHRENGGTAAAANQGLGHCRGEYLARVDADDISLPTRFEEQVRHLDANPDVGLVGAQMAPLGDAGVGPSLNLPTEHDEIYQAMIEGRHGLGHANIMLRTQLLKQIGGYWSLRLQDAWDMMLRMGEVSKLANLDKVLHHYRVHTGSLNGVGMRRMRSSIDYACELARRRRDGRPEISYEEFDEQRKARPLLVRAGEAINLHARCQYRLALAEMHGGRKLAGYARLAWAAVCSPELTIQRIARITKTRSV